MLRRENERVPIQNHGQSPGWETLWSRAMREAQVVRLQATCVPAHIDQDAGRALKNATPADRQQLRINALRAIAPFSGLPELALAKLALKTTEWRVPHDTVIFFEHGLATTLFGIKSGQAKMSKMSEDGREQILHILGPGEVIGSGPTFNQSSYAATATTLVDSELVVIRHADFEATLRANPEIALKFIDILFDRLARVYDHVRDLALQSVPQRTASLLLRLAREEGKRTPDGILIDLTLSREELAELVGSARESVIRALSKFAKAGFIRIERREITILNEERLGIWARG
jgi:CRP/FNR family transcriptional regulator, cyclic AMP receptor protein